MKKRTLKDVLFIIRDNVRIAIENELNGCFAVYRDNNTGDPIDGRYYAGFSKNLRYYLKKCMRTAEDIDEDVAYILAELWWVFIGMTNMHGKISWQEVYEKNARLSCREKIELCYMVMGFIDEYFSKDIPRQIHKEPIAFFRPHVVKKASSF